MAVSTVLTEEPALWRGTTTEERIAPRRHKLLEAGFELLGEHGTAGTTVRGVCAHAKLNPRYFYESFPDLDSLIAAVFDEVFTETTRLTLAAIAAAPNNGEAKTRAALDVMIRHVSEDPRRVRILYGEATGVLADRRSWMIRQTANVMADQASEFYGIPRDDKLLISTTLLLAGGLFELILAWNNKRVDLTMDELIEHATLLVVGTSRGSGNLAKQRGLRKRS